MNVVGQTETVILDFEKIIGSDPLETLIQEGQLEEEREREHFETRFLVDENNFPDQSMYILDLQLQSLRESLGRLKFYISDLDDILP